MNHNVDNLHFWPHHPVFLLQCHPLCQTARRIFLSLSRTFSWTQCIHELHICSDYMVHCSSKVIYPTKTNTREIYGKNVCHVAEMFDFTAWHQMASGTFHDMSFDSNDWWKSKAITCNAPDAIWRQATKSNIKATWHTFKLKLKNVLEFIWAWAKQTSL